MRRMGVIVFILLLMGCSVENLDNLHKEVLVNNIKVKERKELYNQTKRVLDNTDIEELALNYVYTFGKDKKFIDFLKKNGLNLTFEEDLGILLYQLSGNYNDLVNQYKEEGRDVPKVEDVYKIDQGLYDMEDGSVVHDIVITDNMLINYTISVKWVGGVVDKIEIYKY